MSEELKLDPDVTREDAYNWFKSERLAHEETRKDRMRIIDRMFKLERELEELQDAILDKFLYDPMDADKFKILMNAMKQSMERAKQ